MLHKSERKTSEGEANASSGPADPTLEAIPGGRSAGDPTPVSGGVMGPSDAYGYLWSSVTLTESEYRRCGDLASWMEMKAQNVARSLMELAEERWGKP
jgi:hypothetical protein